MELFGVDRQRGIGAELHHASGDVDAAGDRAVDLALVMLSEVDDHGTAIALVGELLRGEALDL
jgi:hypothetical protein